MIYLCVHIHVYLWDTHTHTHTHTHNAGGGSRRGGRGGAGGGGGVGGGGAQDQLRSLPVGRPGTRRQRIPVSGLLVRCRPHLGRRGDAGREQAGRWGSACHGHEASVLARRPPHPPQAKAPPSRDTFAMNPKHKADLPSKLALRPLEL